jgi:hypothetical protein
MSFESNEDYKEAMDKEYTIDRHTFKFVTKHTPLCYRCGTNTHLSYECTERRVSKEKQAAIERFTAIQSKFSNCHGEKSSYAEALKRNRSQSRKPSKDKERARTNPSNKETPMEDRILNLEIKMTTMHNLLMRIANKVQYWEDQEETGTTEEQETMDIAYEINETEDHTTNSSQERQPRRPQQAALINHKEQAETDRDIKERQERLEDNMNEMMMILEKLAEKTNNSSDTSQKQGQKRSTLNQKQ